MPSHLRLRCEQRKRAVGSEEKSVTNLRGGVGGKIESLLVEVLIRLGAKQIASTHQALAFFRRSSKR